MSQSTIESPAMASPGAPTAPELGLFARITGIIFSPRATFTALAARPRWFGMLVFTVVASAVLTGGFLMTAVGQQAFLDMMERRGTTGAGLEMFQKIMPYMAYILAGYIVVISPIIVVILAGILLAVFTLLGGSATFKQVFAVVTHTGVISVLGALIILPLNYFTGSMNGSTNLGVLAPMLDDRSFLALLLGSIDVFRVWLVMVLAIGLGVVYKRKTGPIAVTFFVLYALIAIAYAALAARS